MTLGSEENRAGLKATFSVPDTHTQEGVALYDKWEMSESKAMTFGTKANGNVLKIEFAA